MIDNPAHLERSWTVLLIGGASGSGKTSVSYRLAHLLGVGITEVDDLQIAVEAMTSPDEYPELHYWRTTPDSINDPVPEVITQLQKVGNTLSPAIEAVIRNHIVTNTPVIIDGDFILPSLMSKDGGNSDFVANGQLRAVYIVETDSDQLVSNYSTREPETGKQEKRADISSQYNHWLIDQAALYGVPVVSSRPWKTVLQRVLTSLR